ncbi:M56 family metallopeptidase [Flavobacterium pallidum]|uniref:Peptidase M56 n=1 Tax=Flavobacterium pallidum TaxID=2172098 RepID=A0A2S1SKM4_9FLAO|nr:M56 family metallopeptidase [Flavobacterium pallidum]AWI26955.1 peptidase M56 [Flavobacterium pallidum]
METLLLYLIKSGALMALFYCGYHLLLRQDTFFNANRWYLLGGLFISTTLPLFFIRKVVWVDAPKFTTEQLTALSQTAMPQQVKIPVEPATDWTQMLLYLYIIICGALTLKVIANVISLFRLLHKQEVVRNGTFAFVDLNKNVAPFSFFNYIVYNSALYSEEELQSILNHEKVHSSQKHSVDVLLMKIFSILFWCNPFIWLYKKAVLQNLEYIADRKAISETHDKRIYQFALLRAVTQPNCLSITNNFNQSLIKKRIVMLNKKQSKNRNLWKYALILPLLVAFMLYFQVKVIAQQKQAPIVADKSFSGQHADPDHFNFVIDKNTSDEEIKNETKRLKKYGATLKVSKVKRNSDGEIIAVKINYKDKTSAIEKHVNGKEPIEPIYFSKNKDFTGFGEPQKRFAMMKERRNGDEEGDYDEDFSFSFNDNEAPEAPEPPESIEAPEAPEPMDFNFDFNNDNVIVKSITGKDGKTIVTVNGKVVADVDVDKIMADMAPIVLDGETVYAGSGKSGKKAIVIKTKELKEQAKRAMRQAKIQMEQADMQRESSEDMKADFQEMKAQQQEQMQKMKAEMDAMRAELEKAKAEIKKQK